MGAVFTIFLLVPLFLILVIPNMAFGFVTGNDKTEIILPYDPENGLVWECDVDDPYFQLAETKIDGDNQIFYIRPKTLKAHDSENGQFCDIIFTDKNKNEKKYYVCTNQNTPSTYDLLVYAPGEYYDFEYTVKAKKPSMLYEWHVPVAESDYVLYNPDLEGNETTFTVVHPYDKYQSSSYKISFCYGPHSGNSKESFTITYAITENGAEITDEHHQFFD